MSALMCRAVTLGHPRYRTLLGIAAMAAGLAACGNGATAGSSNTGTASAPGTAGVSLGTAGSRVSATDQLTFVPESQTLRAGQVIEWTNTGTVLHTVTFDAFPSMTDPSLAPGATWSIRFTQPGTYAYHCTIHPGMNGVVVVR